jgi:hypothetical protein
MTTQNFNQDDELIINRHLLTKNYFITPIL